MPARTHGQSNSKMYNSWRGMVERCTRSSHVRFHRYGGRGVTVCAEWRAFANFLRDMGDTWAPGLTIERLDNAKGYEPGNCAWRTPKQQAMNTCRNHYVSTPWGEMTIGEAAERTGIHRTNIYSRAKAGTELFR